MYTRLRTIGWNDTFERHFDALDRPDLIPGRVVGVHKTSFRVLTEEDIRMVVPAGLLLHEDLARSEYPAIGDFVALRPSEDGGVLVALLPRQTKFSRAVGGAGGRISALTEQVIAANIDYVFIVTALDADFSLERIERYVAAVGASGAEPVLILNKSDLVQDQHEFERQVRESAPDLPVHTVSALDETGVSTLRAYFREGVTAALIGSSGVGKSTLTNRLVGAGVAVTGAVREEDGKGRHTTTAREVYLLPGGGVLIDNPGLREIAVWSETARDTFEDIRELALTCRFRGCTHSSEPGCAVRAAIQAGRLDARRVEGYRQLEQESQAASRQDSRTSRRSGAGRSGRAKGKRS